MDTPIVTCVLNASKTYMHRDYIAMIETDFWFTLFLSNESDRWGILTALE